MKRILAFVLSAMLVLAGVPAQALVIDYSVESAEEIAYEPTQTEEEAVVLASTTTSVLDETKGIRILYEDFESFTTFATNSTYNLSTFDTNYMTSASITTESTGWATLTNLITAGIDPSTYPGHGIKFLRTGRNDVYYTGIVFAFNGTTGMTPKAGKYTTEYDQRVAAGSTSSTVKSSMNRLWYNDSSYKDRTDNDFRDALIANANNFVHETLEWTAADNGNGTFTVTWGSNTISDVSVIKKYNIHLQSSNNQWTDNFAIWHYPANSFMLKNGDDLELVTASSTTYTFTATEGVAGWKLGDKIFRAGNTVAVSELEYQTLTAVAEIAPVIDETKGIRILYEDFEYFGTTGNGVTTPVANVNTDYMTSASLTVSAVGWASISTITETEENGKHYLRTGRSDLSHTNVIFNFNSGSGMTPKAGKYTTEYEQKVDSSAKVNSSAGAMDRITYGSTYKDRWHTDFYTDGIMATPGSWAHESLEWTVSDNGNSTYTLVWGNNTVASISTLTSYGIHLKTSSNQYTDNVAIWHYPANSFMLKNGDALTLVTSDSSTYTFTATTGVTAWWIDGSVYTAGDTVNVKDIEYKTLIAIDSDYKDIMIDETYGELLYYHDFEIGGDTGSINYINKKYIDSVSLKLDEGATIAAAAIDPTNSANSAIKLTNNGTTDAAQKIYRPLFTGLDTSAGSYRVIYDVMVVGEGTVGDMHNGKVKFVSGTVGNYTEPAIMSGLNANKEKWYTTLGQVKVTGTAGAFIASYSGCSWAQNKEVGDTVDSFYAGARGTMESLYLDNIKLYHYPANGFILKNGTTLKMKTADGTYTFEPASDVFGGTFNGLSCYTDGTNTYFEGETVNVSDIANKTFTLSVVTKPSTLNVASMRVTNPQGIRIAGFVSTAIRENADEYGFVVALASSFENEAAFANLTMTNEDIRKVSAACYKKGGRDVYYIDATKDASAANTTFGDAALDDLGVYVTGVYANVPETAEAYQTDIVGRLYVRIGDVYYYGAPVAKSVYSVACAIKAKCESSGIAVPSYATDVISVVEG